MVISLMCMALFASAGDVKMIGRDFWVDDEDLLPFSFGVCSWTDRGDFAIGGYANCSLLSFWDNYLRFGMGLAVSSDENSHVDLRLTSFISTLLWKHFELGFYAAPFYNIPDHTDDPCGLMMGYAFWF